MPHPGPTARNVSGEDEIFFGDTYFHITGPVRTTNITVTPNPVVFGDQGKATGTQVMSQFMQSRASAGSGVFKGNPRVDFEKHWKSRLETRYNYLTLPPRAIPMGKPAGVGASVDPTLAIDFLNTLYVAWASDLYPWNDATSAWGALTRALPGTPTDMAVFRGGLYVACGDDLDAATSGGVWTEQTGVPASYLAVYDGKLWKLGLDSGEWATWHSVDGTTWVAGGVMHDDVTPTKLLVYRNALGALALFATSNRGVLVYDDTTEEWTLSDIRYPRVDGAGRSALVFRDGKMYLPTGGLGVASVTAGSPMVAQPMGLDRDDGVPIEDLGVVRSLSADINFLYALIDGTVEQAVVGDEWFPGSDAGAAGEWPVSIGQSTVRAWNGGWHCPWASESDNYPGTFVLVAESYDKQRLYIGANRQVYYIDLDTGLFNPRDNPTREYAEGPVSHLTPWWDFGAELQEKVVPRMNAYLSRMSETEIVDVYYATDLADTWVFLERLTTDGLKVLKIDAGRGEVGRFWRFRLDLQRGSDATKAPIVEFFGPEYLRLLPATYGFAVEIDLTRSCRDKSPKQLLDALKRLSDPEQTPLLSEFAYTDDLTPGVAQTHLARISRMAGVEHPGKQLRGQGKFLVSIIAPYADDAV